MKPLDTRQLDHKTLEAIRMRALAQVQQGESPEVVIKALSFRFIRGHYTNEAPPHTDQSRKRPGGRFSLPTDAPWVVSLP